MICKLVKHSKRIHTLRHTYGNCFRHLDCAPCKIHYHTGRICALEQTNKHTIHSFEHLAWLRHANWKHNRSRTKLSTKPTHHSYRNLSRPLLYFIAPCSTPPAPSLFDPQGARMPLLIETADTHANTSNANETCSKKKTTYKEM